MFIDARTVPSGETIDVDLCIVGAGPAGISLALEFLDTPLRVGLLESGDVEIDADTQALHEGGRHGFPYLPLDTCRLRFFGGTTNHWDGRCRPLEEHDFPARSWVPHSGWPFDRRHLDPYYVRAARLCQLPDAEYDLGRFEQVLGERRLPLDPARVESTLFHMSPPTRFGEVYRAPLERAGHVAVYLNANVQEIETTADAGTVTGLRVATRAGHGFRMTARHYVLAAGGLENARLLLLSNRVQPAGLGNGHDLVGRFFMDHIFVRAGVVVPSDPAMLSPLYDEDRTLADRARGATVRASVCLLTLPAAVVEREQLAHFSTFLISHRGAVDTEGIAALKAIAGDLRAGDFPGDLDTHVVNILSDFGNIVEQGWGKLTGDPVRHAFLDVCAETVPDPDSRVTLGAERDAFGQPRLELTVVYNELSRRTVTRGLELVAAEIERAGLGRAKRFADTADLFTADHVYYGCHHIGTTRMDADPRRGVVDPHGRVHGVANLHVAGSSVFPTCGFGVPTLTIVALALRLAEHLRQKMA